MYTTKTHYAYTDTPRSKGRPNKMWVHETCPQRSTIFRTCAWNFLLIPFLEYLGIISLFITQRVLSIMENSG